jgi:hypothetical protein
VTDNPAKEAESSTTAVASTFDDERAQARQPVVFTNSDNECFENGVFLCHCHGRSQWALAGNAIHESCARVGIAALVDQHGFAPSVYCVLYIVWPMAIARRSGECGGDEIGAAGADADDGPRDAKRSCSTSFAWRRRPLCCSTPSSRASGASSSLQPSLDWRSSARGARLAHARRAGAVRQRRRAECASGALCCVRAAQRRRLHLLRASGAAAALAPAACSAAGLSDLIERRGCERLWRRRVAGDGGGGDAGSARRGADDLPLHRGWLREAGTVGARVPGGRGSDHKIKMAMTI